jgi:8-oxo-dGTP diphosphatase
MLYRVAAAALIGEHGVLIVRRRSDLEHAAGLWSFPGGHIEPGETAAEAVVRELREELGVDVRVDAEPSIHVLENEDQPDGLEISLWILHGWRGTPMNAATDENDELRWVRAAEAEELDLAHWSCLSVIRDYG